MPAQSPTLSPTLSAMVAAERGPLTALARGGRYPDVAAHAQRHAREPGQRREKRADQEEDAAPPAHPGAVRGQQEQHEEDDDHEYAEGPELPAQVRRRAFL